LWSAKSSSSKMNWTALAELSILPNACTNFFLVI
jgi:hypothetical protein